MSALSPLLLFASFLTAAVFVVLHTEHDCAGEIGEAGDTGKACGVCAQLHVISETLKRFSDGPAFASAALASCFFMPASRRLPGFPHIAAKNTPVQAKVKLND